MNISCLSGARTENQVTVSPVASSSGQAVPRKIAPATLPKPKRKTKVAMKETLHCDNQPCVASVSHEQRLPLVTLPSPCFVQPATSSAVGLSPHSVYAALFAQIRNSLNTGATLFFRGQLVGARHLQFRNRILTKRRLPRVSRVLSRACVVSLVL